MSACPNLDPFYLSEQARWVRSRIEGCGVGVHVVPGLHVPGCGSRADSQILVRPGLDFGNFHWILARGLIHQMFGFDNGTTAPVSDYSPRDARLVPGDARIIPFQRPPSCTAKSDSAS